MLTRPLYTRAQRLGGLPRAKPSTVQGGAGSGPLTAPARLKICGGTAPPDVGGARLRRRRAGEGAAAGSQKSGVGGAVAG